MSIAGVISKNVYVYGWFGVAFLLPLYSSGFGVVEVAVLLLASWLAFMAGSKSRDDEVWQKDEYLRRNHVTIVKRGRRSKQSDLATAIAWTRRSTTTRPAAFDRSPADEAPAIAAEREALAACLSRFAIVHDGGGAEMAVGDGTLHGLRGDE